MAYDAMREAHEFVGQQRDEAVSKACEFFGVGEGELTIVELPPGEVYGLGGRTVLVALPRGRQAAPRESHGERRPERGERGDRGDRGGRGRGEHRRERPERRERGERGRQERPERGERSERYARVEERAELAEAPGEPLAPSVGQVQGELSDIGRFVCGAIERMELGPFQISESREGDLVVVSVQGSAVPRLAGKDGRTVDALQLLANQAAGRIAAEPPRVVLDVGGDLEEREARLTKLAQRAAQRARETGRAVRLDPMDGRDRRVIHMALRDDEDIATMSTGEGRFRQVVVVPEGAPEFEDAVRESSRAADRQS
jgi:spoIIIJ-associated protein